MYKCKSCNKPVAENAITCPGCGDVDCIYNNSITKQKKEIDEANIWRYRFMIIGAILLLYGYTENSNAAKGWGFLIGILVPAMKYFFEDKEKSREAQLTQSYKDQRKM